MSEEKKRIDYKLVDETELESFLNQNKNYEPVKETSGLFKLYETNIIESNMVDRMNSQGKILVRSKNPIPISELSNDLKKLKTMDTPWSYSIKIENENVEDEDEEELEEI